ncbi:MAG TPA: glycosyltransferase family 39 protein [Candidatus Binataceae bacterium]|nr:glycosyltransferase family 39 protein [Candidatus Binataceae bacterium]
MPPDTAGSEAVQASKFSPRQRIVFAAILVAAAAIYSYRTGQEALGASEAYSALAAAKPGIAEIVRIPVLQDPGKNVLYYIALHYYTLLFGSSEIALRSLSAVFALASLGLIVILGRELFDPETALAAAAIWAFNPIAVAFAHRARMYPMFIAIALAHLALLWRIRQRPSSRAALGAGLLGAALLYTHLAGTLIFGTEAAMLVRDYVRGRRNAMAWIAMALAIALFVPYVPAAYAQEQALVNGHWLDWIGDSFSFPTALRTPLNVAVVIAGLWIVFGVDFEDPGGGEPIRWMIVWCTVPPVALLIGSIVVRPMFNTRYVAPSAAATVLLISRSISLYSPKIRNLVTAGFVTACLILLPFDYPPSQPWRDFAATVAAQGGAAEPIFFESGFVFRGGATGPSNGGFPFGYYRAPFNYYFQGPNPRIVVPGYDPASARLIIESRVSDAGGGWLVSWKDLDQIKPELPEPDHFKTVEIHREPDLAIYRITAASRKP